MPPPLFVSFYTPAYAAEAAELAKTLDAHGLPHRIVAVPDAGKWAWNCARKPAFIRTMLAMRIPIVWLDADARVRRPPSLLEHLADEAPRGDGGCGICDFACHYKAPEHGYPAELLSGTLYFSGSEASVRLADEWADAAKVSPDVWDQKVLQAIVDRRPEWLNVRMLPASYCQIFDSMAHHGPPVIEHMQASRRLKRE